MMGWTENEQAIATIHYMPIVAGRGNAWASGFAKSIMRQSRNPAWRPSEKQITTIRRLIAELAEPDDGDIFEN